MIARAVASHWAAGGASWRLDYARPAAYGLDDSVHESTSSSANRTSICLLIPAGIPLGYIRDTLPARPVASRCSELPLRQATQIAGAGAGLPGPGETSKWVTGRLVFCGGILGLLGFTGGCRCLRLLLRDQRKASTNARGGHRAHGSPRGCARTTRAMLPRCRRLGTVKARYASLPRSRWCDAVGCLRCCGQPGYLPGSRRGTARRLPGRRRAAR
jgi:hypothetical protein